MAQVILIPTGTLEHIGLARALGRFFPGHTFLARPVGQPLVSFTSESVGRIPIGGPTPHDLGDLVEELVAAVLPGLQGSPPTYACVVEDLEIKNDHQPALVVEVFREAVRRYLDTYPWPAARTRHEVFTRVRERCSFHLFRPMTEAYFFGDPAALGRAGAVQPAQLPANHDLEQFRTTDQAFLNLPPDNRPKKQRVIIHMPDRERHPKSYLRYLCDPTLTDRQRRYKETQGGVAALLDLDLPQVLSTPPHCPFLHSFLDDLGAALNQPLSFVSQAHAESLTRFPGPQNALLRNI